MPSFLREDTPLKGADRGTAYHRVLECLDFTRASSQEEIKEQLAALRSQEKLEEAVEQEQIAGFLAEQVCPAKAPCAPS